GEKMPVPNASSFEFAMGSHWLAVRLNRTGPPDSTVRGSDVVVRDLTTGTMRNLGNVGQFDFDSTGRYLAYTIDATDRLGNGAYLLDLQSGTTVQLNSAAADYDQLVWSDNGSRLAVLRGTKQPGNRQRDNALLAW